MTGSIRALIITFAIFCTTGLLAKELPIKSFSQLPSASRPNLSPDGKQIAFIKNYQTPELSVLTTMDVASGELKHIVSSDNEKMKVRWFNWANNKTLIVSVKFAGRRGTTDTQETRLLAIDVDKKEPVQRQIIKARRHLNRNNRISQFQDDVISFLPDDPDHILIALDLDVPNMPSVYKLNVNNAKKTRIVKGKMSVRDWMADRQGQIRLGEALSYKTGEASVRVKIGDDDTWHNMFEHNALEEPGITPRGFAKDPNILYYSAYHNDKKALFKIDLRTKESKLVFEDPNYDVTGGLIYSRKTNDVIGIYHSHSKNGREYWDSASNQLYQALNKTFPEMDNYIVDFSQDENIYLLYVENDFTPGSYYVGNRKENALKLILEQYPALVPEVLTSHKLVKYTARDGTELEGYLTLPLNVDGPVATIMHPHGGPGAREYDGFDYWTSFFSNRGYAVFRPNFRGSTGYGYEFAQSQMQSWGLEMQDDITDAANWLVAENIARADNICIVGASYGGYAAAMAAVKTPNTFKCAISFAGVTDLRRLVSNSRRYLNVKFVKNQIGDDSSDLKARSPYYNANKITIPMLFIHGEEDRVVDVVQSRKMVEELRKLNKDVEYIELEHGDHYLSIQGNRHILFEAMDAFLKKHLSD